MQKERDWVVFPMNAFQWKESRACCMQYRSAEGADACTEGFCGLFHRSKVYMLQLPLAVAVCRIVKGWQITHTDYTPCILVHSMPFSPFHLFFPEKFSFNSFDGGISWIPEFVKCAFPSVTFPRATLAGVKVIFYNTCHPRCSHHLMNQTGFTISPWNKYNSKSVLHIYPSYTTLVKK